MAQDYTTIRVTEDAKDEAEKSKREDETWNDYILRCTDNPPEVREYVPADAVDGDAQVDYAEIERRIERALEGLQR